MQVSRTQEIATSPQMDEVLVLLKNNCPKCTGYLQYKGLNSTRQKKRRTIFRLMMKWFLIFRIQERIKRQQNLQLSEIRQTIKRLRREMVSSIWVRNKQSTRHMETTMDLVKSWRLGSNFKVERSGYETFNRKESCQMDKLAWHRNH